MRGVLVTLLVVVFVVVGAYTVLAQDNTIHLPVVQTGIETNGVSVQSTPIIVIVVTPTPLPPTRTPTPYPTVRPEWTPVNDYYEPNEVRIVDVNKNTNEITIKNFSVRDIWIRGWILEDAPETWQCGIWDTTSLLIGESRTYHIDSLCGLTEDLMTDNNPQDYVLLTSRYVIINFVRK